MWMHPCHSFLQCTFRRCSRNQSPSCHPVVYLFAMSASYAIGDVGGGAHEVISDLNGLLGSQHFLAL